MDLAINNEPPQNSAAPALKLGQVIHVQLALKN